MTKDEAMRLIMDKLEGRLYGHEYVVKTCPFCGKNDGKFYINIETTRYNCKHGSCGEKGNAITLLKHLGINEVVEFEDFVSKSNDSTKKIEVDYDDIIPLEQDLPIIEYMKSRGISFSTLEDAGVMYSKKRDSLAFISSRNKKEVGVVFRNIDKRISMIKGSKQVLWIPKELNYNNDTLYISEGRIDGLTLCEMGIENVVSMSNGCNSHDWVNEDWDILQKFKKIVLCYDNDLPGKKGLEEVRSRLDFATIYTLEYGDYNDINDMFMGDVELLYETVRKPRELTVDGFISLQGVQSSVNPLEKLGSCGLKQFDKIFGGIGLNQSTIICASSGSGKSSVMCNVIKGMIGLNEKVAIWSGELSNSKLKTWLYSTIAGERALIEKDNPFRPGSKVYTVKKDYEEKIDNAVDGKLFVYDGNKNNGFSMLKHFELLHKKNGVKYFFIDNLSILDMSVKGIGKYEGEEEFSKALASFTRNNAVHVFIVMHPTKQNLNSDPNFIDKNGNIKRPERYDQYSVKGSSSIVNLSHNIMFLQRADEHLRAWYIQSFRNSIKNNSGVLNNIIKLVENEFSVLAYLVKNRETGIVGEDVLFGYDSSTRRIYGLLSKEEDLSTEILKDDDEEDINLDDLL